jgi:hypothetical protein
MRQDISHYIRQCLTSQHIKNDTIKAGTLALITVSHPFELVGWDLMGHFPTSKSGNLTYFGNDGILDTMV